MVEAMVAATTNTHHIGDSMKIDAEILWILIILIWGVHIGSRHVSQIQCYITLDPVIVIMMLTQEIDTITDINGQGVQDLTVTFFQNNF